jgi:serine/threonine protein kinase
MTFGSYEVVRKLGKGGMSEVYEVENVRLGSRHALKLFTYSGDVAEVRVRFLAEGRLLSQLSHPRIVRVTDVGVDEASGRPYFVMDLIVQASGEPCTLADVPPGGADEREIARWYEDLREGLAFIHGKGVIHRDLKLQNVLIGPDGHAVITDFGISKIRSKDLGEKVDPVQTIVRMRDGKNPLMGSLGYLAPELEMGQPASEASDWYSLGVLVFKLLTGVWYDAHMAVRETLETYDPVWLQILPKLLHANPQGRECLSWTELKAAADEAVALKAEDELAEAKTKKRNLCWVAGALLLLLSVSLAVSAAFGLRWKRTMERLATENRSWQAKCEIPDFESMVRVPRNVPSGESEQYELARIDAWVLTRDIFFDLKKGEISRDEAVQEIKDLAKCAMEEDGDNALDLDNQFPPYEGFEPYSSDPDIRNALARLLSGAASNLQEVVWQ